MTEFIKAHPVTINGRTEWMAIWRDEYGSLTSIHDDTGRPITHPEGTAVPCLTTEQMTVPKHPAYDLATKGAAARPDLAERMYRAAALVEDGTVKLMDGITSWVNQYEVSSVTCTCKDFEYRAPDGWCKHRLAVRMARALGQQPDREQLRRQQAEAREQRRLAQSRTMHQADKDWLRSAEGARRYIIKSVANGRMSFGQGTRGAQKLEQLRRETEQVQVENPAAWMHDPTMEIFDRLEHVTGE